MHEILREISMKAWEVIQEGEVNPMEDLLESNPEIGKYLKKEEIMELLDVKNHVGNAKNKSLTIAQKIASLKT